MKKMISYLGEHIEVDLTPVIDTPRLSSVVWVFDPQLWGGKDVGDNSQFWMEAEVLKTYWLNGNHVADVQFMHDGRESKGHFIDGMYFFAESEIN